MPRFEVISKYKDLGIELPKRATAHSAGYDFCAAEDIVVPAYDIEGARAFYNSKEDSYDLYYKLVSLLNNDPVQGMRGIQKSLEDAQELNKTLEIRPTLIPTGVKCYLGDNQYLQLSIRSSIALKNLILLANGVGIIDSDYVDNPSNEGHIMFQVLNLSPFDILIKKGDKIGQGIILSYGITEDDDAEGERNGGFGSTGN